MISIFFFSFLLIVENTFLLQTCLKNCIQQIFETKLNNDNIKVILFFMSTFKKSFYENNIESTHINILMTSQPKAYILSYNINFKISMI